MRGPCLAWLRLNAYGALLVGLTFLSVVDILRPETSSIARIIGTVSPLQPWWAFTVLVAGGCLLTGFVRGRRRPELAGLALLVLAVTVQLAVVTEALGLASPTIRQALIWTVVVGAAAARASVLTTRNGLTVFIPGRHQPREEP